jgi:hypothetical protein
MIKLFYPMWAEQYATWQASQPPPEEPTPLELLSPEEQAERLEERLAKIKEADDKRSAEIEAQREAVLATVGLMPSTGGVDAPNPLNPPPPAALDPPGPHDPSRPGAAFAASTAEAAGLPPFPEEAAVGRGNQPSGSTEQEPDAEAQQESERQQAERRGHTQGTPLSSHPPQATGQPPLRRGS